jgi:CRP/FNR family cyclic AMP-dependent transcriptional regulator
MEKKFMEFFEKFAEESPIFHYLDEDDARTLSRYLKIRQLNRGEVLFCEGDPGDYMVFIFKGSIEVSTLNPEGEPFSLAQLGWGTSVGEMALIDALPRSGTATVVDDAECFLLSRKSFEDILQKHPRLGVRLLMGIAWTMSLRLRYNSRRLIDHLQI